MDLEDLTCKCAMALKDAVSAVYLEWKAEEDISDYSLNSNYFYHRMRLKRQNTPKHRNMVLHLLPQRQTPPDGGEGERQSASMDGKQGTDLDRADADLERMNQVGGGPGGRHEPVGTSTMMTMDRR
ncbi:hypothetical protein ACLOJK_041638 [Asimina triloba]